VAKKKKAPTKVKTILYFEPGRVIGSTPDHVVVADMAGRLWRINIPRGEASPVTFGK
jgi:hypothetical protein